MSTHSCIAHPPKSRKVIYYEPYIELFDGNQCMALVAGYFALCRATSGIVPVSLPDLSAGILGAYQIRSLADKLSLLIDNGWLERSHKDPLEIRDFLCTKSPAFLPGATLFCSWCHGSTLVLHEHHFPLLRSDSGTETVSICPSCHAEFHILHTPWLYAPTAKLLRFLEEHPLPEEAVNG